MKNTRGFTPDRTATGSFLFPARIETHLARVAQLRPTFVGSAQESSALSSAALVGNETGFLWSRGGSNGR